MSGLGQNSNTKYQTTQLLCLISNFYPTQKKKMSDPDPFACEGCTVDGRLMSTQYLATVFDQGWYLLVLLFAIIFFMLAARLTYAFKLWCMFRGTVIAPRIETQAALLAAEKEGEEQPALTGTKKTGYAYSLSNALASDDNKALAVAMSGYMYATGIITWSSISDLNRADGWLNVPIVLCWQFGGVIFLEITRLITDKLIVPTIHLPQEVIQKRNLAAGIVEACSYISSGQVISASMSGPPHLLSVDITSVAMWFIIGQLSFLAFSYIMKQRNNWSFDEEIERDNEAAAVMFGMQKITIAMFLSNSLLKTDSLLAFAIWFTVGTAVLFFMNWIIDQTVLPSSQLSKEVKMDKNWGAALVVTGMTMGVTFILNTFLPETCMNDT